MLESRLYLSFAFVFRTGIVNFGVICLRHTFCEIRNDMLEACCFALRPIDVLRLFSLRSAFPLFPEPGVVNFGGDLRRALG